MKKILLLGCGGAAAYNFIKCVRQHDRTISIVGTDLSRYHLDACPVDKHYLLEQHKTYEEFTDKVNQIIEDENIDFVHAQPDILVKRLALRRGEINALTCLPDNSTIALAQNKFSTYKTLKGAGIPVPESYRISSLETLARTISNFKTTPIWLRAVEGAGSKAALPIKDAYQAQFWIEYWMDRGMWPRGFMASEFLPGPEYALQSLWWEGNHVVSIARERLEYVFGHIMPSGQSSSPSVARIVHNNEVNKVGTAAVEAISARPHGVFGVDMKTAEDGSVKVTEINAGRFYTTNNFYMRAGYNMVGMFLRIAESQQTGILMSHGFPEAEINPVPANQYWTRSIDKEPTLWSPPTK